MVYGLAVFVNREQNHPKPKGSNSRFGLLCTVTAFFLNVANRPAINLPRIDANFSLKFMKTRVICGKNHQQHSTETLPSVFCLKMDQNLAQNRPIWHAVSKRKVKTGIAGRRGTLIDSIFRQTQDGSAGQSRLFQNIENCSHQSAAGCSSVPTVSLLPCVTHTKLIKNPTNITPAPLR